MTSSKETNWVDLVLIGLLTGVSILSVVTAVYLVIQAISEVLSGFPL